jgi:hypothetical protein
MNPEKLRLVIKNVSDRTLSTEQAKNFLEIFGGDLDIAIAKTVREFVELHFGAKA